MESYPRVVIGSQDEDRTPRPLWSKYELWTRRRSERLVSSPVDADSTGCWAGIQAGVSDISPLRLGFLIRKVGIIIVPSRKVSLRIH